MSAPVCYLQRSDRGDRLVGVRLVGHRLDERWVAPESAQAADMPALAARWIAKALADRSERSLAVVCVDPDGSLCSWLVPPSTDRRVVESLVQRSGGQTLLGSESMASGHSEDTGSTATLAPEIDLPGSGSVQVLAGPPKQAGRTTSSKSSARAEHRASDPHRLTVLAMRDASVRLVLDELDTLGVRVGACDTIWQALAAAWDPAGVASGSASHASPDDEAIVGSSELATAIVLIDPAGRLVWAWSHSGVPSACGSIRLAVHHHAEDASPIVTASDIGRLTSDWLAWSAQLGDPPSRIVCLVPTSLADAATSEPGGADQPLDSPALGRQLGAQWADATVSLAVLDDPIGETLERLSPLRVEAVSPPDDPSRALVALSNRPGRAHRSMFVWLALAMGLVGVVLVLGAWRLLGHAKSTDALSHEASTKAQSIYRAHISQPMPTSRAVLAMRQMLVDQQRARSAPSDLERAMPVLDELGNLLWTISAYGPQGLELVEITLDRLSVRLTVKVPTTQMYEDFNNSLEASASHVTSWSSRLTPIGSGEQTVLQVAFTGTWDEVQSP